MPILRDLHFASNIEELQTKAELKVLKSLGDKETVKFCKSAEKLLKEADLFLSKNDEELAYVYFFRFIQLVLALKQRPDFHQDTALTRKLLEAATIAIDKANALKASLLKRYEALQEAEPKTEVFLGNKNKLNDESPQTRKIEDIATTNVTGLVIDTSLGRLISASQLLSMLNDRKCVIMDTRSAKDYEESHIKHSSCINIPSEIVIPGLTAKKLQKLMPEASKAKWQERNSADDVILIDWYTATDETSLSPVLKTLEQAMCKWTLEAPLPKKPLILKGGYKEWYLRYPMHCTKKLDILALETPTEQAYITDVSDINFPDIDDFINASDENEALIIDKNKRNAEYLKNPKIDNFFMSKPSVNRQNKPREQMEHIFTKFTGEFGTPFKLADKPKSKVDVSSLKLFEPPKEMEITKFVPEVNRNLKPVEEEGGKEKERKNNSESGTSKKCFSAEDMTQEPTHLEDFMECEANIPRNNYSAFSFRPTMEIKRQIDLEDKDVKHFTTEETRSHKQKLSEDVEMKEPEKEMTAKELLILELERSDQEKMDITENNPKTFVDINKLSSGIKDAGKGEFTVPLKRKESDSSSHFSMLTRSHSSPNIAQMDEPSPDKMNKHPTVDRSLKPKIDTIFAPVRDNKPTLRNLNSTCGSCQYRPLTGIRNLGNTCYMNSVIQSLSNTQELGQYFSTEEYRQHIRRNNKQGTNGKVAEEFAGIIRDLWMGSYKSIAPKDFKNVLSKYIPMVRGSNQQDSHEFLVVLMEKLHYDLNQGNDTDMALDSFSGSMSPEMFWKQHVSRNNSKLSQTFEGLLQSTLSCITCKETSKSYEVFSCLSLPISSSRCKLKDCLASFLKTEKMSGEGAWFCPTCKQKQEAEKTLKISVFPRVLIIQLKRFSYDGLWRRKLQTMVDYQSRLEIEPGKFYELYALVNHFGLLEGGHYMACCKNANKRWYQFDDHDVSEVSFKDIQMSAAYLLFYQAEKDPRNQ